MTTKETMSITKALAELKLLDSRVAKTTGQGAFVTYSTGSQAPKVGKSVEEFTKNAQADLESVRTLIKRRGAIKAAVVVSNATTKVDVAGRSFTVAEAIEYKNAVKHELALIQKIRSDLATAQSFVDRENLQVQTRLDQHVNNLFGKEGSKDPNYEVVAQAFRSQNEAKLVDPLGAADLIRKMETEVEDFLLNVDYVLSESNTLTKIDVVY